MTQHNAGARAAACITVVAQLAYAASSCACIGLLRALRHASDQKDCADMSAGVQAACGEEEDV